MESGNIIGSVLSIDITTENRPMIQITTANPRNTSVNIKLRRVTDFYVELDKV